MIVKERAPDRESVDVPAAPAIRSRRNPKWIALGVMAVCLGAVASFFLYSQLFETQQVVAVRASVPRGTEITSDDVGVVRVGDLGGVRAVPAAQLPELIGGIAAHDLVEGSLVPVGAVTRSLPPDPGQAVVGIRVTPGRAPTGFLPPGSPVRLVVLPPGTGAEGPGAGAGGDGAGVATVPAVVVDTRQLDDGLLINLEMDAGQAVDAASYAAQDRIAVIRESER